VRLLLALVLVALALSGPAGAALTTTGVGGNNVFGPPPCSNSLDFTQACNSQYVGVF
jgi:hypothetical protein